MADDARLSCGRSIDDVWSHLDGAPDEHERSCPYCLEARARLLRLSDAAADLRVTEVADPALQPDPGFAASVMGLVRAEVRRGQAIPLDAEDEPGLTISEQAVVGLVWAAADSVPGIRARRCRVRVAVTDGDGSGDLADPGGGGGQPMDVESSTLVDVSLSLAVQAGTSVVDAAATLRARVAERVGAESGLRVRRVDLAVEDVS